MGNEEADTQEVKRIPRDVAVYFPDSFQLQAGEHIPGLAAFQEQDGGGGGG